MTCKTQSLEDISHSKVHVTFSFSVEWPLNLINTFTWPQLCLKFLSSSSKAAPKWSADSGHHQVHMVRKSNKRHPEFSTLFKKNLANLLVSEDDIISYTCSLLSQIFLPLTQWERNMTRKFSWTSLVTIQGVRSPVQNHQPTLSLLTLLRRIHGLDVITIFFFFFSLPIGWLNPVITSCNYMRRGGIVGIAFTK